MNGLTLVLRFEVDAYEELNQLQHAPLPPPLSGSSWASVAANGSASPNAVPNPKLALKPLGRIVPLPSRLEIKTHSQWHPIPEVRYTVQLWLTYSHRLIVAPRDKGRFEPSPEVRNMAERVREWETANSRDIRLLTVLLKMIREAVKSAGG
jgi:hypothetical protein